ncbi:MAG: hypothetical protein QOJ70_2938 [Acidobacteriota bacterium]|jgi:hypothetical protein|nr:hypothetical protein [Acidobacteriota bacterium]MDT7809125.1 hypothetical protein [Acidobacteriota bacterium]
MFSTFIKHAALRSRVSAVALLLLALPLVALAQSFPKILEGDELTRVVPSSFYFEGQSAPTQMRNAAAVQFGASRFTMAALVDASGYSSEVQAKYQGFFITDSPIMIEGVRLGTGAYGFGFTKNGRMTIMDVGGRRLFFVRSHRDAGLQRPRPLMMTMAAHDGVRLYNGRDYVTLLGR